MRDRIANSVFWIVWSRVGLQTLSFISTLLVARLLDPSDYGLMAMATVWTAIISLLAELGLGPAIVQFRDLEDRELNAFFWLSMTIAIGGYLVLFALSPTIAAWFGAPRLSAVLRVLGLTLPLLTVRIVPENILRKRLALDRVSQAEIGATAVTIPVVLFLAWMGAGVWALVAGALVRLLVQDTLIFFVVRWLPGFSIGGKQLREVMHFSLATLGSRLCWSLYQHMDAVVVGKASGGTALGFYSMAKELALLPVTKISAVINQLILPIMSELQADRAAMRASLLQMLRLVACVTFPACVGFMLVADDLVRLLLTDKWVPIVPMLRLFTLYAVIRSLDVFLPPILLACYQAKFVFVYTLALLIVMSLVFWIGATWYGVMGVVVSWVIVYPLMILIMAAKVCKELEIKGVMIWEQMRLQVVAVLIMAGVVLVVQWRIPGEEIMGHAAHLAVISITGALVYSAIIFRRGEAAVRDFREVLSWIMRPQKSR